MTLADLLRENLGVDDEDVGENERTPTPVRCFAVRLHSMGLSVREVEGVLTAFTRFGGAVRQALSDGCGGSDTTTTETDRIKR